MLTHRSMSEVTESAHTTKKGTPQMFAPPRVIAALFTLSASALASAASPMLGPVPVDFILFACVLAGVALLHKHSLKVAVVGAVVISLYKILMTGFKTGDGLAGLVGHLGHEWVLLANLLCLLVGFALLSNHFEDSRVQKCCRTFCRTTGRVVLCCCFWCLSCRAFWTTSPPH